MKPGSGGLECDIGGMDDIIGRRRGSLGAGMVEASMAIRLNKDMIERDPTKVAAYKKDWKTFIPTRPDYPADYFDELASEVDDDEAEDQEEELSSSDSDSMDEQSPDT
jgi:hypothetical protein